MVRFRNPQRGWSLPDDEGSLAWIFGSSRSGSTWLLKMLGELAGVATIDDPHLGHHLGVWRPIPLAWAREDEGGPDLSVLPEVKRERDGYLFCDRYRDAWEPALRDLVAARFQAQANDPEMGPGRDTRAVVVKEPGSQCVGLIMSLFPRSKLIFLLRDGRDVVDSWLDAYSDGSWALDEGAFPLDDETRLPFIRWQASVWKYRTQEVRRAYEECAPERRLLVRYEDLRESPVDSLAQIATLLDLEVDPSRLGEVAQAHDFSKLPDSHTGNGKRERLASPGGWRENMSRKEQRVMLEIIGDELEDLGYRREDRSLAGRLLLRS